MTRMKGTSEHPAATAVACRSSLTGRLHQTRGCPDCATVLPSSSRGRLQEVLALVKVELDHLSRPLHVDRHHVPLRTIRFMSNVVAAVRLRYSGPCRSACPVGRIRTTQEAHGAIYGHVHGDPGAGSIFPSARSGLGVGHKHAASKDGQNRRRNRGRWFARSECASVAAVHVQGCPTGDGGGIAVPNGRCELVVQPIVSYPSKAILPWNEDAPISAEGAAC